MTQGARPLHAWVFQTGEPLPHLGGAARPMRAANVTDALLAAGHRVTLWSSDFNHLDRRHFRGRHSRIRVNEGLEVRLIHSMGYSRNIGTRRLADHAQLAIHLKRLLAEEPPPNVAFVGYPPIEPAAVMTRWLRARNVPVLLDVKDQWPEVLLRAIPRQLEPVGRVALSGYAYLGRRAMRDATGISSISEPFLDWALTYAQRDRLPTDFVAPLTARPRIPSDSHVRAASMWWDERGIPDDSRPRVAFVGTLGSSFDMRPVARAARENPDIQFVLCGTGSRESHIRQLMDGCQNVVFPGWVDHDQSISLYRRSIAALAPYSETTDFNLSIPNKIFDALIHGLPVATSLQGTVKAEIIDKGAGFGYDPNDGSLGANLVRLASDPAWGRQMTSAALRLHEDEFSFAAVYGGLVAHMEDMADESRKRGRLASRV